MKRLLISCMVLFSIIIETSAQKIPISGSFFFVNDIEGNTRLVCSIKFTESIVATVICSNKDLGETNYYGKDKFFSAFSVHTIGYPFTQSWTWMPGEVLTIKAAGYDDFVYRIPYMGTPEWYTFVAQITQSYQTPSYTNPYQTPSYQSSGYEKTESVCPHCNGTGKDPYDYYTAPHYTSDRSCCSIPKDQPGSCKVSKVCFICGGLGRVSR